MPRYYFDTEYGGSAYRDVEGVELPSLEVARHELERLVRDITHGQPEIARHTVLVATVRCDGEIVLSDRRVADEIAGFADRPSTAP
jgi:hypothetical protein